MASEEKQVVIEEEKHVDIVEDTQTKVKRANILIQFCGA